VHEVCASYAFLVIIYRRNIRYVTKLPPIVFLSGIKYLIQLSRGYCVRFGAFARIIINNILC
jgi:hypothetical protein